MTTFLLGNHEWPSCPVMLLMSRIQITDAHSPALCKGTRISCYGFLCVRTCFIWALSKTGGGRHRVPISSLQPYPLRKLGISRQGPEPSCAPSLRLSAVRRSYLSSWYKNQGNGNYSLGRAKLLGRKRRVYLHFKREASQLTLKQLLLPL